MPSEACVAPGIGVVSADRWVGTRTDVTPVEQFYAQTRLIAVELPE